MDLPGEEKQRREFRDILFSLAKSQEILKETADRAKVYKRLEDLYYAPQKEDSFRHFYSDIFSVLTTIKQGDAPGSIDVLGQNLAEIRKGYRAINRDSTGNLIDISDNIKKLYDHVSLDIARMGYSDAADRELSQQSSLADIQAQIETVKSEMHSVQENFKAQAEDVENSLNGAQKDYIAILGIFAAVVLAFTGGIAFSTSVFQNLHNSSIYRVLIVSLIIGLVLINVLYGLFFYVDRLVNKKTERKTTPLWIPNAIFLILIVATIIGWYTGVAEKRNVRIENSVTEIENIENAIIDDSVVEDG